jgi:hypothetical protein
MTIQRGSGIGLKVSLEYLANDGIWKDMKKSPGAQTFFRRMEATTGWVSVQKILSF